MSLSSDILSLFPSAKEQNGYMRIRCPYHKNGQERHPSLSILLQNKGELKAGFAKCFTCGWTGTFKQIAEDMGYEYVSDTDYKEDERTFIPIVATQMAVYKGSVPFKFSEYLHSRGIDIDTQKLFKVYYKQEENKVYMPVFSREGKFLYANARSTETKRFFVDANSEKTLAGIEMVDFARPIAICESQIDAMTFYASGFCRAVATLGATTIDSLKAISGAMGPFFLAFDSDDAGRLATKKAMQLLGSYRCKCINFGEYKDANNLWQAMGFDSDRFADYIESNMEAIQ